MWALDASSTRESAGWDWRTTVAVAAFVLAALSFYWNALRRGTLRITDGPTYALHTSADRVVLYYGLNFTNTGRRDWIVRNVRAIAPAISQIPMTFVATHQAMPGDQYAAPVNGVQQTGRHYAYGFVVPAGQTVSNIFEFQSGRPVHPWVPDHFEMIVLLQPRRSGERYVFGARFPIRVDTSATYGAMVTRENAEEPDPEATSRRPPWYWGYPRIR